MGAQNFLDDMRDAEWRKLDPGDGNPITSEEGGIIPFVTGASGETNTLPDPLTDGMLLILMLMTDGGGDRVVTASTGINAAGDNTMTFAVANDTLTLFSVPTASGYRWQVIANQNVTIATV